MTITALQGELVEEFAIFEDWMDKYEYLIELGKSLPIIDPALKIDNRLIKGCQSNVWLDATMQGDNVIFTADSDAIITKGIVAILVRVFSNQAPEAIVAANTKFIDEIGLKEHLSPTRANGLLSMIKQMKLYAVAFQAQLKNKA